MKELPNLTLEWCGGKKKDSATGFYEWYPSIGECSSKRNIPFKILYYAKKNDNVPHHGFNSNGSIRWDLLQAYLRDNYTVFLSKVPPDDEEETRSKLELRKLKAEVVKLENFNKSRSKDFVSRKLVLTTINELIGNTSAVLRRWLEQEQPFKADGMSAIQLQQLNKDILVKLFADMQQVVTNVETAADLNEIEETNAP